jgi:ATP-dependent RNA helicase DeaD
LRNFAELGIQEPYVQALADMEIVSPTEIQVKAIPFLVETGTDFIGQAQTGTGKTAAFGLPLLAKVDADSKFIQGLILAPTRELCQQISKSLFRFTKYLDKKVFVEAVYGGAKIVDQMSALKRPTQILVATPGRLIDLLDRGAVNLSHVNTAILDEADEMLSMGFKDELESILNHIPTKRATWLFSATMPEGIQSIIDAHMSEDAFRIQGSKVEVINRDITHQYVLTTLNDKFTMLRRFLDTQGENRGVIFCRTKADTQNLAKMLVERGIIADSLHGDLMQKERDKAMRAFKKLRVQILVATDLAARGIDVENLAYVVHYDIPEQLDYYTHRSGRTARAGRKGISLAFVGSNEMNKLHSIEKSLDISFKKISL